MKKGSRDNLGNPVGRCSRSHAGSFPGRRAPPVWSIRRPAPFVLVAGAAGGGRGRGRRSRAVIGKLNSGVGAGAHVVITHSAYLFLCGRELQNSFCELNCINTITL